MKQYNENTSEKLLVKRFIESQINKTVTEKAIDYVNNIEVGINNINSAYKDLMDTLKEGGTLISEKDRTLFTKTLEIIK